MSSNPKPNVDNGSNKALQQRRNAAFSRGQGNVYSVFIERASGSHMWDVEGKRYIDFGSGIAVCNIGHLHPEVQRAVSRQMEKFSHTCVGLTPYENSVQLAERLNELVPGDSAKKSMFVTTGAEAVENSIKIAKAHTGRRGIISFGGGFHGRTLLATGLTGKTTPYKNLFGPFPADIYHVPFPIDYHGISLDDTTKSIEQLFKVAISPSDIAAVIVEPVQGEGGFYPASSEFLHYLRDLCDQHGIVLIADEVQTGIARTGKFFCSEYAGIEPDIITTAKGLAGGLPLAAVTGKSHIMDAPLPGGLGGTFAGSPVGCAAALAVMDVIANENLTQAALHIGKVFRQRLEELQHQLPDKIGDIRCDRGAMMAIELVSHGDSEQPDADLTAALTAKACQHGLILLSCGSRGNVIRFLPALTISDDLIHEGLDILERCFTELIA